MAVHSLAVSPEDIKGRLPRVYNLLADLSVTEFPEALQADFEWVMSNLTAQKRRQSKTAEKIAQRIVYLADRISTLMMTN